eukprot:CAMPEP_0178370514 /NCGR_PEP_ID=MMETSP0689_2-20121128/343_1 /TAXON_ID=160604 /ORGANISM="Amphidinium massartii, Strain CS-259" /LENGTH=145 /DNA_ID=CAMNT_0019990341 /DNA_START=434 /DNA_END=872 /DNA_ORIENTATION=+
MNTLMEEHGGKPSECPGARIQETLTTNLGHPSSATTHMAASAKSSSSSLPSMTLTSSTSREPSKRCKLHHSTTARAKEAATCGEGESQQDARTRLWTGKTKRDKNQLRQQWRSRFRIWGRHSSCAPLAIRNLLREMETCARFGIA